MPSTTNVCVGKPTHISTLHPTLQMGWYWIVLSLQSLLMFGMLVLEIFFFYFRMPELSFLIALCQYEFDIDKKFKEIKATFNQIPSSFSDILQQGLAVKNFINLLILISSLIYSFYIFYVFLVYKV